MNHAPAQRSTARPRASSSPDLGPSVRPLRRSDPPPKLPADKAAFVDEVVRGLGQTPKRLPTARLFDAFGARLYACLATTTEHPLLRSEHAILAAHAKDIAGEIGAPPQLAVAHRVLGAAAYAARAILGDRPPIPVVPFDDATAIQPGAAVFLGGSIIGELEPRDVRARLAKLAIDVGSGGHLVAAIDLKKDARVLEAAYADASGIAAAFSKNALARMNRELGADFDLGAFEHQAVYDADRGRVELRLVSSRWQWAAVGGHWFNFGAGEAITTMVAYKYTIEWFSAVTGAAGWSVRRVFLDPSRGYAIVVLAA